MKELNKTFSYRGYEFNITVFLNTTIERRINGERFHTIRVNCLGADNYYSKTEVSDSKLAQYIEHELNLVRNYVDKRFDPNKVDDSETQKTIDLLTNLGFE